MLWIVVASVVVVALLCATISYLGERRAYRRQRLLAAQRELKEARAHRRCLEDIATARNRTTTELARIASEPSEEAASMARLFRLFFGEEAGR
jgi:hypothetical protein